MNKREANEEVGRLSKPSKMPCPSWSIPAFTCKIGVRLAVIQGSVCSDCYALKGMYQFPCTVEAMMRRYRRLRDAIEDPHSRERFISAFVVLLKGKPVFRWHDSGDLQCAEHLDIICEIARRCPKTRFWLPTREHALVHSYAAENAIPANLVVRLSTHMIDHEPRLGNFPTSTVHTGRAIGAECRAYTRDGHCGGCRKCWNPEVGNVSYPLH